MSINKQIKVTVRLSSEELKRLQILCDGSNKRKSVVIRELLLKGKVVALLNAEELILIRKLTGMSNNLNQVAKSLHDKQVYDFTNEVTQAKSVINDLLKSFDK